LTFITIRSETHAAGLHLFALVKMTLIALEAVIILGTSWKPITLVVKIATVHWWTIRIRAIIGSAIVARMRIVTRKPTIRLRFGSILIIVALRIMIPLRCLRTIHIRAVILIGIRTVIRAVVVMGSVPHVAGMHIVSVG
jgi:hypothetical protein